MDRIVQFTSCVSARHGIIETAVTESGRVWQQADSNRVWGQIDYPPDCEPSDKPSNPPRPKPSQMPTGP